MKICSLYGAGLLLHPGTDTCIKIGGALRIDTAFNAASNYDVPYCAWRRWRQQSLHEGLFQHQAAPDADHRYAHGDRIWSRSARSPTFISIFAQGRESIAGGYVEVDFAFIQFAGFTFGKAVSQFDPQWALAKPTIASGSSRAPTMRRASRSWPTRRRSATAFPAPPRSRTRRPSPCRPVEREHVHRWRPVRSQFTGAFYGSSSNTFLGNATGGNHMPDVVGNLRLDQAWGTLHFAAALHQATAQYYTNEPSRPP